jgi:hypothetical protein
LQANGAFVPPYLDMAEFGDTVRNVEAKRVLVALLDQFSKTVSDSMLAGEPNSGLGRVARAFRAW